MMDDEFFVVSTVLLCYYEEWVGIAGMLLN